MSSFHAPAALLILLLSTSPSTQLEQRKVVGAAGEWDLSALSSGKHKFAIGDPPPRAPRLPPNATCAFQVTIGVADDGKTLTETKEVHCVAAHNYFHDFEPSVNASGSLLLWPNKACDENFSRQDDEPDIVGIEKELANSESAGGGDLNDCDRERIETVVLFVRRGGCAFSEKILNLIARHKAHVAARATTVLSHSSRSFLESNSPVAAVVIVDNPLPHEQTPDSKASAPVPLIPPGLGDSKGIDVPVVMISHASAALVFPSPVHAADPETIPSAEASAFIPDALPRAAPPPRPPLGSVLLVSATLDDLRGRGRCQCAVESPQAMQEWHFMHREGVKERLDFVVDEGKRALMCFSQVRTVKALAALAHLVPPFSTVGVSQAVLDEFVAVALPRFTQGPIILVTSDYNSDRSAPKPFNTDHSHLLEDPERVAHWFSDNWYQPPGDEKEPTQHASALAGPQQHHPRLTLLPIGINDRHTPGSHGDRNLLLEVSKSMPRNSKKPNDSAYANFHHSQGLGWWEQPASGAPPDRAQAFRALRCPPPAASIETHGRTPEAPASMPDSGRSQEEEEAVSSEFERGTRSGNNENKSRLDVSVSATGVEPGTTTDLGVGNLEPLLSAAAGGAAPDPGANASSAAAPHVCSSSSSSRSKVVHFEEELLIPRQCWDRHRDFAFEVCPQGNGVDTHRVWEALVLNTIPIVKTSALDPLYQDLPVVVVQEWSELSEPSLTLRSDDRHQPRGVSGGQEVVPAVAEKLRRWHEELSPLFEGEAGEALRARLSVDYWVGLIRAKQRALRESRHSA